MYSYPNQSFTNSPFVHVDMMMNHKKNDNV